MKFLKTTGNFFVLGLSALMLLFIGLVAILLTLPDVAILEKCFTTTMYEVRLCPDSPNYVKLKSISPYMIHALIAAEDAAFYSHKGFDWHEMQASFETNLKSGRIARGGSTLTQQLAKNAFLSKDKSYLRKIKEAYLANAIENRFKKDFILEKYLNVVEFGANIYGIKPAALHYFHKNPSELHPLEAAYLAFLLPNPKLYSQSFRKGALTAFARKQVGIILKRMSSFGKLSPSAYETAKANINDFPWSDLSMASFEGTPTWDLEAPHVSAQDLQLDEEALEEIIEETDTGAPAPVPAQAAPEPAEPSDLEE
jgi:monofunctional biosynthetic peptidoglycan transglycosylase